MSLDRMKNGAGEYSPLDKMKNGTGEYFPSFLLLLY